MAFITLSQLTKAVKGLVNKINSENNLTNSKIGTLSDLNTTTKDNLVAAVNEVKSSAIISETDPTVPAWAKSSTKPSYTAAEVGALPDTTSIPTNISNLTNDSNFFNTALWTDIDGEAVEQTGAPGTFMPRGTLQFPSYFTPRIFNFSLAADGTVTGPIWSEVVGVESSSIIYADIMTPQGYTQRLICVLNQDTDVAHNLTIVFMGLADDGDVLMLRSHPTLDNDHTNSWIYEKHSALPSTTTYAASPQVGGSATFANGLHFAQVDSTSTETAFTVTIPGITEYYDGLTIILKNGVVTSASGFTINVNGLGAKHSYTNLAASTADTTIFNINYTMMFVYDSTRVSGGGWICYRGYDANTNTIGYQLRTNSTTMPMSEITYRYRLFFTSADGKKFVPANTSSSTNATATRTVNQTPIDPHGRIVYYGTTASVAAGSRPSTAYLWTRYVVTLGYSFNRTGAALTLTSYAPVYIKAAPQTNGSAIIDATTPYVQALPTTADGMIYIFLGTAASATTIELVDEHPIYCYRNGSIQQWTGIQSEIDALTARFDALDIFDEEEF